MGSYAKVLKRDREARLLTEIVKTKNNFQELQIQYMYYDIRDDMNEVCRSSAFTDSGLVDCVLPPII